MQKVRMYVNGCTRKIRFNNVTALNNYLSSQTPLELEIEGCVVTDATGYFDFRAPLNGMSLALSTYSYVVIELNDGADTNSNYYAFIDKIDINNFNNEVINNEVANYYRCYFTIDWWTTIGLKTERIKKSLEGEVVRAHILDINDDFHPTLIYTLDEPEVEVDKFKRSSIKLNGEQKWLYIFSTKNPPTATELLSTPSFEIGDKKITSSVTCYLGYVGANSKTARILMAKYYLYDSALDKVEERTERFKDIYLPDAITDSSVVSIYITDYMPFPYHLNSDGDIDEVTLTAYTGYRRYDLLSLETSMINLELLEGDGENVCAPILRDVPSRTVFSHDYTIKTRASVLLSKPTTYEEYLSNNISKTYFAPYTYTTIEKNGKKVVIDTAYIDTTSVFEYNICPMISGYVVYAPSTRKLGETAYSVIEDNSAYERTSTNDNFTKLSAMSSSIGWLGKTLTGVALGATIGMTGGAGALARGGVAVGGSLIGAVSSGISEHSKWVKTLRDGEDGTKIVGGATSDYLSPLQLVTTTVIDDEMLKVRKDLALYGYNTYLHPHEVFEEKHLRRYFNYIKTVDCDVAIPLLNESVRKDIESMFNNGVWLWNTDEEFGNFEVPNYPLIMEV